MLRALPYLILWCRDLLPALQYSWGFSGSSDGEESVCSAGELGSIPGSGRCLGEGNGNPLQYSCLENPMDRGAWRATFHGVARVLHDRATNTQYSWGKLMEAGPLAQVHTGAEWQSGCRTAGGWKGGLPHDDRSRTWTYPSPICVSWALRLISWRQLCFTQQLHVIAPHCRLC